MNNTKDNKTIIRNLLKAKGFINQAIEMTTIGNFQATGESLRWAIYWIYNANKLILRKHMVDCMPMILQKNSKDRVIDEVMKTYKYIHL